MATSFELSSAKGTNKKVLHNVRDFFDSKPPRKTYWITESNPILDTNFARYKKLLQMRILEIKMIYLKLNLLKPSQSSLLHVMQLTITFFLNTYN